MSETGKHTAGKWFMEPLDATRFDIRSDDGKKPDWYVAQTLDMGQAEEGEANARLISAAPDLLAALQAVVRVADRKTDEFDLARAAIKKATQA